MRRWSLALLAFALVRATEAGALENSAPAFAPPEPDGFVVPAPGAGCSKLALAQMTGEVSPELWLAERTIEREWTDPGDSGVVRLAGGRSEMGALALSAVLPGAGQIAMGERRGLWFAAAEALGWVGWWMFRRDADELEDKARAWVGSPEDSASTWSFERWSDATGEDATSLRALYAADQEAFYDAIARDTRYVSGWVDVASKDHFDDLLDRSDQGRAHARGVSAGLWVNHLLAAADAFRGARVHNLAIRRDLQLKARGRLDRGRPSVMVALERRF